LLTKDPRHRHIFFEEFGLLSSVGGGDWGNHGGGDHGFPCGPPGYSHAVLVTAAANQAVNGGVGDTIIGAYHDTITGADQSSIVGGNSDTITGGADDTIIGGTGDAITGGPDDLIWMGACDKIVAAAGDSIVGGKTPGFDTIQANGGHETVTGTPSNETVAGFDTVTGPGHDEISFAGESQRSIQNVVATQEQSCGNTTLHLPDGSSITLVGVTHVTNTFFH
jgi:hypothetical protein